MKLEAIWTIVSENFQAGRVPCRPPQDGIGRGALPQAMPGMAPTAAFFQPWKKKLCACCFDFLP